MLAVWCFPVLPGASGGFPMHFGGFLVLLSCFPAFPVTFWCFLVAAYWFLVAFWCFLVFPAVAIWCFPVPPGGLPVPSASWWFSIAFQCFLAAYFPVILGGLLVFRSGS